MIMKLIHEFLRMKERKKSENFWKISEKGDSKIHLTKSTEDQLDGDYPLKDCLYLHMFAV